MIHDVFENGKRIQELYKSFNDLKQEIENIKKEHQQEIERQNEYNNELKEALERQTLFYTKLQEIQQEHGQTISTHQQQAGEKFHTISSSINNIQQDISLIKLIQEETNQKFENMKSLQDEILSLKTTLTEQDNKVSQLYNSVNDIYFIIMKKRIQGEKTKEFAISSHVTSIVDDAFSHCSSLTQITIPSSVTSIGDKAFYGCSSLTQITIPS